MRERFTRAAPSVPAERRYNWRGRAVMAGPRVKPEDDAPGSLIFACCLSESDIDATKGCFKNESSCGEREAIAVTNLIRALSLRRDKKISCAGTRMSLREPQGILTNILKTSQNLRRILDIMAKNDTYSLHAGTSAAQTGLSRMQIQAKRVRQRLSFKLAGLFLKCDCPASLKRKC
jgi:hypothetical protein